MNFNLRIRSSHHDVNGFSDRKPYLAHKSGTYLSINDNKTASSYADITTSPLIPSLNYTRLSLRILTNRLNLSSSYLLNTSSEVLFSSSNLYSIGYGSSSTKSPAKS